MSRRSRAARFGWAYARRWHGSRTPQGWVTSARGARAKGNR